MEDWQKRVIEERDQLLTKIHALGEFIRNPKVFDTLKHIERDRLMLQRDVMRHYLEILDERIADFPKEPAQATTE